jgi:hypothetical protein
VPIRAIATDASDDDADVDDERGSGGRRSYCAARCADDDTCARSHVQARTCHATAYKSLLILSILCIVTRCLWCPFVLVRHTHTRTHIVPLVVPDRRRTSLTRFGDTQHDVDQPRRRRWHRLRHRRAAQTSPAADLSGNRRNDRQHTHECVHKPVDARGEPPCTIMLFLKSSYAFTLHARQSSGAHTTIVHLLGSSSSTCRNSCTSFFFRRANVRGDASPCGSCTTIFFVASLRANIERDVALYDERSDIDFDGLGVAPNCAFLI